MTGCNQTSPDTEDNEIAHQVNLCLSLNNSTRTFNSCFKELFNINKSTHVVLLGLDKHAARTQWLNEMSQQTQRILKNNKINFEAINLSEKNLTIDFFNQTTAKLALKYLNHAGIQLTQIKNQLSFSDQAITKFYRDNIRQSIEVFNSRLKQLNLLHATIRPYSDSYILILIPDEINNSQQEIIQLTSKINNFEARLAYSNEEATCIFTGKKPMPQDMEIMLKPDGSLVLVSKKIYLTEENLNEVYTKKNKIIRNLDIGIIFKSSVVKKIYNLTSDNISKALAIIIKNNTTSEYQVLLTPIIRSPIKDGHIVISGVATEPTIRNIADSIRATIPINTINIIINATIE